MSYLPCLKRLREEHKRLLERPITPPLSARPAPLRNSKGTCDIQTWMCTIPGPPGSMYEGAVFDMVIKFPNWYPEVAPRCYFKNCYHLNVNSNSGYIRLATLGQNWDSSLHIQDILELVQGLLGNPDPNHPENHLALSLFLNDHDKYLRKIFRSVKNNHPSTSLVVKKSLSMENSISIPDQAVLESLNKHSSYCLPVLCDKKLLTMQNLLTFPDPADQQRQKCSVIIPFIAKYDDEINLNEGDIITILNKETGFKGWWKGKINGCVIMFPGRIVQSIPLAGSLPQALLEPGQSASSSHFVPIITLEENGKNSTNKATSVGETSASVTYGQQFSNTLHSPPSVRLIENREDTENSAFKTFYLSQTTGTGDDNNLSDNLFIFTICGQHFRYILGSQFMFKLFENHSLNSASIGLPLANEQQSPITFGWGLLIRFVEICENRTNSASLTSFSRVTGTGNDNNSFVLNIGEQQFPYTLGLQLKFESLENIKDNINRGLSIDLPCIVNWLVSVTGGEQRWQLIISLSRTSATGNESSTEESFMITMGGRQFPYTLGSQHMFGLTVINMDHICCAHSISFSQATGTGNDDNLSSNESFMVNFGGQQAPYTLGSQLKLEVVINNEGLTKSVLSLVFPG